ncbi:HAD family phosphatase [Candidatus Nomurabacteria bacterium]|nr:HAD family phosphatase [Candidatus Nomurabacteria bacterium]
MNTKKLVIVDLDQTLLDSPKQQLPSLEFIQTVKGSSPSVLVGCATGRSYSWTLPVLEASQFTAPCILGGGAIIVDPKNFSIKEQLNLPAKQLDNIKQILSTFPDIRLLFNDYVSSDYLAGGWELSRLLNSDSCYLMDVIGLEHELANNLIDSFNGLVGVRAVKMNGYNPGLVDILVTHQNATKTSAIDKVQKIVGINKDNTYGIGNGYNDLQLFDAVGTKIAVGNAVTELKNVADVIIGEVSTDPVTSYLRALS